MSLEINRVVESFNNDFSEIVKELKKLVRIPSISIDGFPPEKVQHSAQAVAQLMKNSGVENVEVLTLPGVHSYVYGEKIEDLKLPTLLLYAHHDVQPVGREDTWNTDPFEPIEKQGPGGIRMYGRGTADDKAGIMIHLAAIRAYLAAFNKLPVNIKMVIDGEEETGSSHLKEFLEKYKSKLSADVLVLTDTLNYDVGTPGLTVSLRGLADLEVEVHSTSKVLHSGMWSGPIPDPAMALSKILSSLVDENGAIAIESIRSKIPKLTEEERREYEALPFNEKLFREQSGILPGSKMLNGSLNPNVQIWRQPSLTVNAIQSSSREQVGNTLNESAWAKVSIRVPPKMKPELVLDGLKKAIQDATPWGCDVRVKELGLANSWYTDPRSEENRVAYQAASSALERAYGKKPFHIGSGGTIPFVEPFAIALGGIPALLVGVEDPYTNAHGENESMHMGDFKSACLGQIFLFEELGKKLVVPKN